MAHSGQGILWSQQKYTQDLLTEISFSECQLARTLTEVNHKLTLNESEEEVDIGRYQRLVGKLISLVHTRPDISDGVNILCHFMHSP